MHSLFIPRWLKGLGTRANAPHSWLGPPPGHRRIVAPCKRAVTLLGMPVDITFTMTDDQVARASIVGQLTNPDLTPQELKAELEVAAKRGVIRRLKEWNREARRAEYIAAMEADAETFDSDFGDPPA